MMKNIDSVFEVLGQFGHYQKIRVLLVCLYSIVSAWHSLNMVFVGSVPQHHCNISGLNNSLLGNLSKEDVKSLFIPPGESCHVYNRNSTYELLMSMKISPDNMIDYNRTLEPCWNGIEFSQEKITIASEFRLVCKRRVWRSTSKSVYFFGRLCGAVLFGQLSDRFGRRPTFILSTALLLLAGSVCAAAPSMSAFLPMYFLQGAAQTGAFLVAYTLCTELVGPKYRVVTGFIIPMFYSLGYMSLAGLAYLLRDWRHLEIVITVPNIIFLLYWWFLPESVRFLLTRNRHREAEQVLKKVAETNRVTLPSDTMAHLLEYQEDKERKYYFIDLVRTWKMARISLNVWFNWMVNALVYYGLSLNTENLGGDPYINFCIAGAVEIPSYLACLFLLNKVGRRWPLILTMLVGGVACIISGCVPVRGKGTLTLTVVLAMVGKIGITASYAIIYLLGAEVFPTGIRNIGMGVSSMSARIGGIVAPQILELRHVAEPLPLIVFGILSMTAGGLALLLPETLNQPLPQTLDDVPQSVGYICCRKSSKERLKTGNIALSSVHRNETSSLQGQLTG